MEISILKRKIEKKKTYQGLETSRISSPIILPPAAALLSQLLWSLRQLLVLVVLVWCGVVMILGPIIQKSINI